MGDLKSQINHYELVVIYRNAEALEKRLIKLIAGKILNLKQTKASFLGWLLIGALFIIQPSPVLTSPELDQFLQYPEVTTFNNTYFLVGSVDQGSITLNLEGELSISSRTEDTTAIYLHDIKTILGVEPTSEAFEIKENLLNKTLDFADIIGNPSIVIMDDIWLVYSNNGTNPVASIYHIVRDEIEAGEISFLNFTTKVDTERAYFSPYLEADIQAYSLRIVTNDENHVIAYFDTRNRVLLGFDISFRDSRVQEGEWLYSISLSIASTDLELPILKESKFIDTIWMVVGSSVIIIALFFIIRRLRSPKVLKGGLD